ncbi:hypothetical protein E0K89_009415 [Aquicoccus sp. SCR17]|nr:hypothetical protein [Carideicomes alvinocaridis]
MSLVSPLTISVWVVTTVACVLSGPFGTYASLSFADRTIFWPTLLTLAILAAYLSRLITMLVVGPGRRRLFYLMHCLLSAALIGSVLWLVMMAFYGADPARVPPLSRLVLTALAVSIAVGLVRELIPALRDPFGALLRERETPRPRLADRLEDPEATIIRLTVEDHFVDVISDRGRERLRMRFSDAVNEMEPIEGFCTHRSHWVASAAVMQAERQNGRLYLRLDNGEKVPVSRKYREDLESAGVIEPREGANRGEAPGEKRRA